MDKSTNTVNISICAINFVNAVLLLIFSDVFDGPPMLISVAGIVFFIVNAVFALILLILVIVSTVMAALNKNPDTRYQPMHDDRGSFIKSQTQLTTELDALGATARGEGKGGYKGGLDLDDDNDSWDTESMRQRNAANMPLPPTRDGQMRPGTANSNNGGIESSVPLFPTTSNGGMQEKNAYQQSTHAYQGAYSPESRHNSDVPLVGGGQQMRGVSPSPVAHGYGGPAYGYDARGHQPSPLAARQGQGNG